MSDNPMLGAKLILDFDKATANDTLKILTQLKGGTNALSGANDSAAAAAAKAAAATKAAADAAKQQQLQTRGVADALAQIGRQKALDELANKWAKVAKQTKDAAAAQAGLQKDLNKMNATGGEIQGAAGQFAEGGGTGRNKLARLGSEIRALPSIQTGLGFGTDAIGNILRVGGAIGGLADKSAILLTVTTALTPALGATAAGVAAIAVVAAPFVIAIAAIGLAIKAFADDQAKQAEVVQGQLDAQRSIREKVLAGATTDDLTKDIEKVREARRLEADDLAKNQAIYDAQVNVQTDVGESALSAKAQMQLLGGVEQVRAEDLDKQKQAIIDLDASEQELTAAIADGITKTNDAAEAEKKLAEERTKATLDSAAAAGQEVQMRNRADKASFEQNEQRLVAIQDEKEAIEAQLAVLTASGDTSEEVTGEIDKLNGSLTALGKESSYISDTALAASKARDAEKKAIKDAEKAREDALRTLEQAEKKRLDAGKKYSENLIDIATDAADKAEDALRGLGDKLAANEVNLERDLDKLTTDANRDRLESELEAQQEEAADLREHQRDLESIRDDALADEEDALKKRDFLGAARIREAANLEMEEANKAFEEGQDEKAILNEEAMSAEERELENARQDRLVALQQQNADARTAYDNRIRDDEIATERAERQAGVNRDRELASARELADSVSHIKQLQGETELAIAANTLQGIAQLAGAFQAPQMAFNGSGGNVTNNQNVRSVGSLNIPINGATNMIEMRQIIMQTIDQVGLMPSR